MKITKTFIISCTIIIMSTSIVNAAQDNCKISKSDLSSIKYVINKNKNMGKISKIYCPDIIDNYAKSVYDNDSDGGIVYLIRSNKNWKLLVFGTMITDDDLIELGMPKYIADRYVN